jgi:hypothetical protein
VKPNRASGEYDVAKVIKRERGIKVYQHLYSADHKQLNGVEYGCEEFYARPGCCPNGKCNN